MTPLYRCIGGMDVHRMLYVITVLIELADGNRGKTSTRLRRLRDRRALGQPGCSTTACNSWLPGKYRYLLEKQLRHSGKGGHSRLPVVNAGHARNVPGRETDRSDSEWLARLRRFGLVKPSFIPSQDLRELRWQFPVTVRNSLKRWPEKRTACIRCSTRSLSYLINNKSHLW